MALSEAKVSRIKEWALENYEKSYGASCLIECFSDKELAEKFTCIGDAKAYAKLMDELHGNAWCDAY
jgi:hypothetical protein